MSWMGKPETSIRPDYSYTYYPQPDSPFELIDVEKPDYGAMFDEARKEFVKAVEKPLINMLDAMHEAKEHGQIDITLGSIGNYPGAYGHMDMGSTLTLLMALCIDAQKNISFRSEKEGYAIVWNILVRLIEILGLDEEQTWNNLIHTYGMCGGVSFVSDFAVTEFRITALALKLMGQKNWMEYQESDNHYLDDFGHAIVFKEETPTVLIEKGE